MSQRLVLFAKTIVSMDRPQPIEDGFVLVQGSRILQVGQRKDREFGGAVRVLDLGDTILLPGFINAHCHLDFTGFKGKVPFQGVFREWLREMGAKTRKTSALDFKKSVEKGIRESLSYGTTTLCDVSTSWESYSLLRQSGLRAFVFFEMIDLAQPSTTDYWKSFREKLDFLTRGQSPQSIVKWGLSPHTPFTVSRELMDLAGRYLGSHRNVLATIHLGESREEGRFFKKGTGPMAERIKTLSPGWPIPQGTTPVQYLSGLGWLPKLNLGVHLNLADEKDMRLLSKNRIAVVHCPGSHGYFSHLPFKYKSMRRHRIPVCLGTDSLASNQSLSLFREMRLFSKAHPGLAPAEILSMVTTKPAQALGMGDQLGQIRPGFQADLIGIPTGSPGKKTLWERILGYSGKVSFSMVQGEPLLRLS